MSEIDDILRKRQEAKVRIEEAKRLLQDAHDQLMIAKLLLNPNSTQFLFWHRKLGAAPPLLTAIRLMNTMGCLGRINPLIQAQSRCLLRWLIAPTNFRKLAL